MLHRALKTAKRSDHFHHRHATLLFKGSVLVAAGYNLGEKHAEIMALNKVKHKGGAKGTIAFNVRVTKGGRVGIAKPCVECRIALILAGVKTVLWTDENGNVVSEKLQGE